MSEHIDDDLIRKIYDEYDKAAKSVKGPGCVTYGLYFYVAIVIVQIITAVVYFAIVYIQQIISFDVPVFIIVILGIIAVVLQWYVVVVIFKKMISPLEQRREMRIKDIEKRMPEFRGFYIEWKKQRRMAALSIISKVAVASAGAVGALALEAYKQNQRDNL